MAPFLLHSLVCRLEPTYLFLPLAVEPCSAWRPPLSESKVCHRYVTALQLQRLQFFL